MKESDDKYSNRIADAEQLTKEVQAIYSEIKVFEDAYKKQIAPLKQKIAQLEESFLDKWLVDSTDRNRELHLAICHDYSKDKMTLHLTGKNPDNLKEASGLYARLMNLFIGSLKETREL